MSGVRPVRAQAATSRKRASTAPAAPLADPMAEPRAASAWAMPDRPSRSRLIWRRTRARMRTVLVLLMVFGGIGAAVMGVQSLGRGADFGISLGDLGARAGLKVTDIVLEGREKTPLPAITRALSIRKGDPILAFSPREAQKRLEAINWVQSATVLRRLPGTIVVQIVERRPFAVWQLAGPKFVLIDRAGAVVTDSDVGMFADELLLVVGEGADKAAAGLIDALAAHPALQARVATASWIGQRRWNLQMKGGTEVLLPEGATMQALARLVDLQASHALLDRQLKLVDLRLPDRLTLRPNPDPKSPSAVPTSPATASQTGRKT
jgi:cell division protein FtsQ